VTKSELVEQVHAVLGEDSPVRGGLAPEQRQLGAPLLERQEEREEQGGEIQPVGDGDVHGLRSCHHSQDKACGDGEDVEDRDALQHRGVGPARASPLATSGGMRAVMPLVPSNVESLQPYVPGKPIEEVEREYGVRDVAKLASNENALGPSPRALAAAREACGKMHLYPDGSAFYLRGAIAKKFGVPQDEVVVGNGSNELIELIVRTFVLEGEEVLTSAQSFVAYRLAAQAPLQRTLFARGAARTRESH
jgi:hypothetical protein